MPKHSVFCRASALLHGIALVCCGFLAGTAHEALAAQPQDNAIGTPLVFGDAQGRNVVLYESRRWRVVRQFPSGYTGVQERSSDTAPWTSRALTLEWRRRIHPMQIGEGVSGELFIASYDLIDNLPSGRSLSTVTNGIDVWRVDPKAPSGTDPERIVANLQLGGIDSAIYADFRAYPLKLCGENQCYSWSTGAQPVRWKLDELRDYEFVEVAFSGDQVAALMRPKHDDRQEGPVTEVHAQYSLAKLDQSGSSRSPAQGSGIPWQLRWIDGQPRFERAETPEQYRQVFVYDIMRMPFAGAMAFGSNNFEGRIAWSQAYYLHGMLSALEGLAKPLFTRPPAGLRERVRQEAGLVADLCTLDYPGYLSKRYSVDREPLKSVLHLGRIGTVLARAKKASVLELSRSCVSRLKSEMGTFDGTLEEPIQLSVGGRMLPYLGLRKGLPFWADGISAPYNYVSGYAEGTIALGLSDDSAKRLTGMMAVIQQQEFGSGYPNTWRYCANSCDKGWLPSDSVSLNAPVWKGNGGALAHISYRTMDARALLELASVRPAAVDTRLAGHFRELTRSGWLLPSINELFAKTGGVVPLSKHVAKRHARASAPWELQSSIWALNQLARDAAQR